MKDLQDRPVIHHLTRIDQLALMADCSVCGRVKVYPNGNKPGGRLQYRCAKALLDCRKISIRKDPMFNQHRNYGPSVRNLPASQGGRCALCDETPKGNKRSISGLVVDHDHKCCPKPPTCGKCTRGMLCSRCNIFIGYLEFIIDSGLLEKALSYIKRVK